MQDWGHQHTAEWIKAGKAEKHTSRWPSQTSHLCTNLLSSRHLSQSTPIQSQRSLSTPCCNLVTWKVLVNGAYSCLRIPCLLFDWEKIHTLTYIIQSNGQRNLGIILLNVALKMITISQVMVYMSLISALGRQAGLWAQGQPVHRASSKTSRTTQRNHLQKKNIIILIITVTTGIEGTYSRIDNISRYKWVLRKPRF
jgi:hypothetical protein